MRGSPSSSQQTQLTTCPEWPICWTPTVEQLRVQAGNDCAALQFLPSGGENCVFTQKFIHLNFKLTITWMPTCAEQFHLGAGLLEECDYFLFINHDRNPEFLKEAYVTVAQQAGGTRRLTTVEWASVAKMTSMRRVLEICVSEMAESQVSTSLLPTSLLALPRRCFIGFALKFLCVLLTTLSRCRLCCFMP